MPSSSFLHSIAHEIWLHGYYLKLENRIYFGLRVLIREAYVARPSSK